MGIESVVNVQISLSAAAPSKASFGAALIAAYHTVGGSARVLGPYSSVAQVTGAGFASNSPVGIAAAKYFSQNPTPTALYIGRRALPFTQKVKFTPLSTHQGDVYNVNTGATAGVGGTLATYTVPGSASLATVCTGLAAAIQTAAGGTADGTSGTHIEWTASSAGTLTEFQNQVPLLLGYVEDTVDPGIATDLAAIWTANQSWYGLILDSYSVQEVEAAALWVESNKRIFPFNTCDTECADNTSTSDVISVIKADGYARTGGIFVQNSNMSYAAAAWLGNRLTAIPGSDTWAFKLLVGVTADTLPPGWDTVVMSKEGSVYTSMDGVNFTRGGSTGSGEWFDIIRGIDWLVNTIQVDVLTLFLQNSKVPYDDHGIEMVANVIRGDLHQGVVNGLLVDGTPAVSVPLAANVSSADKSNRVLNGVSFTAEVDNAVHATNINGTLTD